MQYGYRMGKAALNIAGATLARDLKPRSIPVALIHPGVVRLGDGANDGMPDNTHTAGRTYGAYMAVRATNAVIHSMLRLCCR